MIAIHTVTDGTRWASRSSRTGSRRAGTRSGRSPSRRARPWGSAVCGSIGSGTGTAHARCRILGLPASWPRGIFAAISINGTWGRRTIAGPGAAPGRMTLRVGGPGGSPKPSSEYSRLSRAGMCWSSAAARPTGRRGSLGGRLARCAWTSPSGSWPARDEYQREFGVSSRFIRTGAEQLPQPAPSTWSSPSTARASGATLTPGSPRRRACSAGRRIGFPGERPAPHGLPAGREGGAAGRGAAPPTVLSVSTAWSGWRQVRSAW